MDKEKRLAQILMEGVYLQQHAFLEGALFVCPICGQEGFVPPSLAPPWGMWVGMMVCCYQCQKLFKVLSIVPRRGSEMQGKPWMLRND